MGGSLSLRTGAQDFDLAGVIAFYASLARKTAGSEHTTLEEARHIHYPVLGLFGGADQGIPASDVQLLKNELGEVGVEHEIVIYPGAPHSFFDLKQAEFADASADAWTRVLNFINTHNT
jgi:carboxymethylenebutenolidase